MCDQSKTKFKPTREELSKAIDTIAEWFPEEVAQLQTHREAIITHIFEGTEPAAGSALSSKQSKEVEQAVSEPVQLAAVGLSPCQEAVAVVLTDAVMFALGLVGLHVFYREKIARALIRELGGTTLNGLSRAVIAFEEADGAFNKAKALFAILGGIWNAGGFRAVFKVLKDNMSWWEWVKTGVIAVAQIAAWFASDGAAFIAEAVLSIMSATQLIEDAVKAASACS